LVKLFEQVFAAPYRTPNHLQLSPSFHRLVTLPDEM
jgi:hypothetical protein